ncbi:MAG: nucleoside 2-deoxyribosyltransferase [Candidatus Nanoarchaeia archaeon]|nr:nucleoside 2-deoxyribosyltransferase [Candidatus Nanoarchaeia archaeon]MDD5740809.1 nucleoside 2-deoxyribosyltransferase [Candidatus Nanoarchaeia archaeon]
MKIQIAYKFTGEDRKQLEKDMKKVCSALKSKGHDVYCTLFDKNLPKTKKELFQNAFNRINNSEIILVLIKSEDKSEGLLMEVGYSIANKKRIILAIKNAVKNTHLRDLVEEIIEFEDIDDLINKLNEFNI